MPEAIVGYTVSDLDDRDILERTCAGTVLAAREIFRAVDHTGVAFTWAI